MRACQFSASESAADVIVEQDDGTEVVVACTWDGSTWSGPAGALGDFAAKAMQTVDVRAASPAKPVPLVGTKADRDYAAARAARQAS